METPVRILHIDDNYLGGGPVEVELERRHFPSSVRFVTTRAEFLDAIARQDFDVILSDCRIPSDFTSDEPLTLSRSERPDLPFILLAERLEEDEAIEALGRGATDYVLKDNLSRLVPAIERALAEVRKSRQGLESEQKLRRMSDRLQQVQKELGNSRRMQEELRVGEEKYRRVFDSVTDAVAVVELVYDAKGAAVDCVFLDMNPAFETLAGVRKNEHLGHRTSEFFGEVLNLDLLKRVAVTGLPASAETYVASLGKHLVIAAFATDKRKVAATFTDITERKEMEEALLKSQHRLSLVQEVGKIGVFDWNVITGQVVWTSEFARLLGMQAQGKWHTFEDWFRLIHPDDRPRVERMIRDWLVSDRNEERLEYQLVRPDGDVRWMALESRLVRGTEGLPVRVIGASLDITERKKAEETLRRSEQLYRAIGETINWGIWVCDPDGKNSYASPSFLKMVGMTQEECSGDGWGKALHPDDADATIAAWKECCRAGTFWERAHQFKGADGKYHHVLARGIPVRNEQGAIACWAGINLDIDEMMGREEEMGRRVERSTNELMKANQELESFRYSVSHDLRAPLRLISGFARLLVDSQHDHLSEKQREYLQLILENADRMNALVDALLAFSRIPRHEVQATRVDVRSLVEGVIEKEMQGAGAKVSARVAIVLKDLPTVDADPVLLRQVFTNLISNALKYTRNKPHPKIEVGGRGEEDSIVYYVRDNGVGFPAADAHNLFHVFTRPQSQGEDEGSGMGLASVRKIIEQHSGKVWAEGEKGKGATFYIALPRQQHLSTTP
jgi:PAS domain S-box-containing protein